uniref:Uncharacterized protein n=1 Tax=Moniliophthora roreri TaxID=221103 RepID=A0A0W0G2A6_MONRR
MVPNSRGRQAGVSYERAFNAYRDKDLKRGEDHSSRRIAVIGYAKENLLSSTSVPGEQVPSIYVRFRENSKRSGSVTEDLTNIRIRRKGNSASSLIPGRESACMTYSMSYPIP